MTDEPAGPPSGPWLPEHLRGLTRETATDEQRAEIRAAFRQRLNDLDAYWTPARRAERNTEFEALLAKNQIKVDARNAAEAADPSLRWRRLGTEAARSAVVAERVVPVEGVTAFRAAFDEALPQARAEDPLGRTGR
ncbi:hypothetical protein ACQEVZ_24640 [Dactylosporangium sp. CA-152071]|uniref:hypothetical protein n=1 Tax=Dactylosporangium sp. CA-152071 TaxID=3239933 RepID=UPI003D8A20C1